MSFLESFSSEFRTFQRIPKSWQTKNEIGEIEKTEMLEEPIIGVLLEKKRSYLNLLVQQQVNYRKTDRNFFFQKDVSLNKDDVIVDWDLRYTVMYVKKQIVFNAEYDHNVASLSLIE